MSGQALYKRVNLSRFDPLLRSLKGRPALLLSSCSLLLILTLAAVGPLLSPYDHFQQNLALGATPPSIEHVLGTDIFGRDLFARLVYGLRISIVVSALATLVALVIGVCWGAIAGYCGGRVDLWMMRAVDVLYALPFSLFVILLTVVFGRNLLLLFLAIGAVEWLTMARIVRSQVLELREREFVLVAQTMGLSSQQIVWRHILPNILGVVVVYTALMIPGVILLESFLSFLGLGIQAPESSLGSLIAGGVESMEEYPWLLIVPSFFLGVILLALNVLGDALRDQLDPQHRGQDGSAGS